MPLSTLTQTAEVLKPSHLRKPIPPIIRPEDTDLKGLAADRRAAYFGEGFNGWCNTSLAFKKADEALRAKVRTLPFLATSGGQA